MESISGHIHKVLEKLESNPKALTACISGLKAYQDGQIKLNMGNSEEALPFFIEAENEFKKVPEARYMLGCTNTSLAASHANIRDFSTAASYARAAIFLLHNNPSFSEPEANAHMTLGYSLYCLGLAQEAEKHYDSAHAIYIRLPNNSHYLQALESNRGAMRTMYSEAFQNR